MVSFGWCAFAIGVNDRVEANYSLQQQSSGRQASQRNHHSRPHKIYNVNALRDNLQQGRTLVAKYGDPYSKGQQLFMYLATIYDEVQMQQITIGKPAYHDYEQQFTEIMTSLRNMRRIGANDDQPEGCPLPVGIPNGKKFCLPCYQGPGYPQLRHDKLMHDKDSLDKRLLYKEEPQSHYLEHDLVATGRDLLQNKGWTSCFDKQATRVQRSDRVCRIRHFYLILLLLLILLVIRQGWFDKEWFDKTA